MSSSIVDERVVQMGFDNKSFETNVRTSMSTLDKLKQSLNFTGMSNSLNQSLGSMDMSLLTSSLEKASEGFTTMQIIAITAISNITNKIIDMGLQLVSSLSIEPIIEGWEKYAEKTASVATLMAQGFDYDLVEEQLGILAWYADETSYSFTDMLSNITKFTASGQGLEESTNAMMGIANWAALSGQNATTASRAMYQLSQAMSAGYIRWIDWKSIQNANMDTQEIRKAALETAADLGILTRTIDGMYMTAEGTTFDSTSGFIESLSQGWFTIDTLMTTLNQYGGAIDAIYEEVQNNEDVVLASQAIALMGDDLDEFALKAFKAAQEAKTLKDAMAAVKESVGTVWTNIFENIFGTYEEAKVVWTDLVTVMYDLFVKNLVVKQQIVEAWNGLDGRMDLFDRTEGDNGAFWNLLQAIENLRDTIKKAWNIIFPLSELEEEDAMIADVAQKLKNFTSSLKENSKLLLLNEEATQALTNIFTGLFSVLKIITKSIGAVWYGVQPLLTVLKGLGIELFYVLGNLGARFTTLVQETTIFTRAGEFMYNIMDKLVTIIKEFNVLDKIKTLLSELNIVFIENGGNTENYTRILAGLKAGFEVIKDVFQNLYQLSIQYLVPAMKSLFNYLTNLGAKFGGSFIEFLAFISDSIVRFNEFNQSTGYIQNGLYKLVDFIKSIPSRLEFLLPYLERAKDMIIAVWQSLKKVPAAVKSFIDSFKNSKAGEVFTKIAESLKNFVVSIKESISGFSFIDTTGVDNFTESTTEKFRPLLIVLEGLGKLFMGVWSVAKAVIPIIGQLIGYLGELLGWLGDKLSGVFSGEGNLFQIDRILDIGFWAVLVYQFSEVLDFFKDLQIAFAEVFDDIGAMLQAQKFKLWGDAAQSLSTSMLLLVAALVLLASIDPDELNRALIALGIIATILATMMKTLAIIGERSVTGAIKTPIIATGMMIMAGALLVMALALKLVASLNQDEMVNGILGITMLTSVLVGAAAIIGKNQKMFKRGARGLIKMAIAVGILAISLKTIGRMNPKEIQQGMLGVASLVGLSILFAIASSSTKKAVRTSIGMIGFATSLIIASVALKTIGELNWTQIAKGTVGLAAIASFMIAIGLLSRHMKKMIFTAVAMNVVAGSLLAFALVFQMLAKLDWTAYLKVGLSLVTLTGTIYLISKFVKPKLVTTMATLGLALASLGAGLIVFGLSMKVLGSIDPKQMWNAFKAIIFLVLGLSAAAGILGFLSPTMIAFGAALLVLGSGLLVMASAFAILGTMNWGTLAKGLGVLALSLAILAVAAQVVQPMIVPMLGLSVAMLLFGVAALTLAVALSIITTTLAVFGRTVGEVLVETIKAIISAIPYAVQAFTMFVSGILDAFEILIPSLLQTLGTVISSLSEFIKEYGPEIVETIVNLLDMALASLTEKAPTIMDNLITIILEGLEALKNNIKELTDVLVDIILGFIDALTARIPEIIVALSTIVTEIIDALVEAVVALVPKLVTAAFDLVLGIIEGLGQAIEDNTARIKEAMVNFAKHMWNAFLNFYGINSPSKKFMEAAGYMIDGLVQGFTNFFPRVATAIRSFGQQLINKIISLYDNFVSTGTKLMKGLGNGLRSSWTDVRTWSRNTATEIVNVFKNQYNNMKSIGSNLLLNIKTGAQTFWNTSAIPFLKNTAESIGDFFSSGYKGIKDIGENLFNKLKDGFSNVWSGNISPWLEKTANSIGSFFSDGWDNLKNIGKNLMDGLTQGIVEGWNEVWETIGNLGEGAIEFFKDLFGIHSPSRVFAEIGEFIDLGLAKGLNNESDSVYDSAEKLANNVTDGVENSGISGALAKVYDALNSEISDDITITPVMDLTEIEAGANQIYSMMKDIDGIDIQGSNKIASRTQESIKFTKSSQESKDINDPTKVGDNQATSVINNTFNISGTNAKEIADEVSRAIQKQIVRRRAEWAK